MRFYGISELAAATGQRPDTISQWYRRGKLPPPDAVLAMGPLWVRSPQVARWIRENRRG